MYINAFEEALVETQRLRENIQSRVQVLQSSLYQEDGALARDSLRLLTAFEREFGIFDALEKRFDSVGKLAIRAGSQVETAGQVRRRAMEARELLQMYAEVVKTPDSTLGRLEASVLAGTLEGRSKAIITLRRLVAVAQHMGIAEILTGLETVAGRIENQLLALFHSAFDGGEIEQMRQSAHLIGLLNGGQSCVQSFVNQHSFFQAPTNPEAIMTRYRKTEDGTAAILDYSTPEAADPIVLQLFAQILATLEQDWKYICSVFEEPTVVMDALLTRIFHEPVQVCLEETLHQAKQHSLEAYLRSLNACVKAAKELVKRLSVIIEDATDLDAQSYLDTIFSPHLATLGEDELASLEHILKMAIAPLVAAIKTRKNATARSFLRPSTPVNQTDLQRSLEEASVYRFTEGEPLVIATEGAMAIPSPAVVRRCLMIHAEATARIYSLLPSSNDTLERLWTSLLNGLMRSYVIAALDIAHETGEFGASSKTGHEQSNIAIAAASTTILSDIQSYLQNTLLPVSVTASPVLYRQMVQAKNESFSLVASKISTLLMTEVRGNIDWIEENLLSKQKRSDFKPKGDDLAALVGPSPACQAVVAFLKTVTKNVLSTLDLENARLYLSELASQFHSILIEHVKKYSISETGALLLRKYKTELMMLFFLIYV